jgi:NinB protein
MNARAEVQRSIEQNKKMWAMLADISRQKKHCGKWLPDKKWKILFLEDLNSEDELQVMPSLDGQRFVPFTDYSTSKLSLHRMADLINHIQAWGDQHGVKFSNEQGLTWEAA